MNEVKNGVLFSSIVFGLAGIIITILMGIEFCRYREIIDELEQRVKEQTMLIELLQGDKQ